MTNLVLGKTYLNFINGRWVPAVTNETVSSTNPANPNEILGYVQNSREHDLDQAVAAAQAAKRSWCKLSGSARGDILFRVAAEMEDRLEEIAETMTREMGKTFVEAKGETARGVAILRYYAGEGMRKVGDVIPSNDSQALMFTTRVPLGVVGIITPWNFPVAIPVWKIAPALVYGNAVVFKPSEETSITATKIVECFQAAGLPDGVLNLVTGQGSVIGRGIAEHKGIEGISFTGSNGVGKMIGQSALLRGAKYQLEMGGKNPILIADDADLDLAVEAVVNGAFKSTGQKCTATSRVLVQRGVYETFKAKLLSSVKSITIGDGLAPGTWMGPCANKNQFDTVRRYIAKGVSEGAKICFGGSDLETGVGRGYFIHPTIFENVSVQMSVAREEIFGPVLCLIPFDTLEEGLEIANDSEFGLCASLYTRDIGRMLAFINDMEAGLVRINAETAGVELQAPFGGMKQSSSHTREQGTAAIEFFTAIKTVFVKP